MPSHLPAEPLAELERRIKWPLVAVGAFLAGLLGLLVMVAVALFAPAPAIVGLPDDPDARAAREAVRGLTPVGGGALRFQSALIAADSTARPITAADAWRIERARVLLERTRTRLPNDPRLVICLAHLDLARRLYEKAEARYRGALYFGDHCPDAHLGLGVTLALEAQLERDVVHARGLQLEAIAQFAAVRPRDEPWLAALYNRAALLGATGRHEEARRWARVYLEHDPASPWAQKLREDLGLRF
jgi:tetratricopeptide (TPR) repeat protein